MPTEPTEPEPTEPEPTEPEPTEPEPANPPTGASELSAHEVALLNFEKRRFNFAGTKQQAIAQEFGYSETRYYQEILRLIKNPLAVEREPVLVHRLRRVWLKERPDA